MKEFIVSRGDTAISAFVIHKFTIKHSDKLLFYILYLDIIICFHIIPHTFEHNFSCIFKKLAKFGMLWVYSDQYTKVVSKSRAVSSARMHETSTHRIFQTFHSRDLSDQWLFNIDQIVRNRGHV